MRRGHCEDRPKRWRGVPELSVYQFYSVPKVLPERLRTEKIQRLLIAFDWKTAHDRTITRRTAVEGEIVGPLGVAQRGGEGERAGDGGRADDRHSGQE